VRPSISPSGDQSWIDAIGVLALSEDQDPALLDELFLAIDGLLEAHYQGGPEEKAAIAAIGARADTARLPLLVERAWKHVDSRHTREVREWHILDAQYKRTLIATISDLTESLAADFSALLRWEHVNEVKQKAEIFNGACKLMEQIGLEFGSVQQ